MVRQKIFAVFKVDFHGLDGTIQESIAPSIRTVLDHTIRPPLELIVLVLTVEKIVLKLGRLHDLRLH